MKQILVLCTALCLAWNAQAQRDQIAPVDLEQLETLEDTLGLLAYAIVNDSLEENRFGAVRVFIPKLVEALKHPHSFHYPFEQLQTVSIQYPQDSTFRIFTWQLYVDKDTYRYFGTIQMDTEELQLFPLRDRSDGFSSNLEQAEFTADEWYGALYYNIKEVEQVDGQKHYLLFGYDADSFFRKRKLVDVLTFPNGKPLFGKAVFVNPEEQTAKKRLVLEYSAAASIKLNYDPAHELILFDNLTTVGGSYGEGPVNIPDGTYQAYQLKAGQWEHIDKVFHTWLEEAPRPAPVLDGKRRGILGDGGQ
ncbi:MAG: hypothetical protein AAGJ82_04625 [Bacteroidota bacterium]